MKNGELSEKEGGSGRETKRACSLSLSRQHLSAAADLKAAEEENNH